MRQPIPELTLSSYCNTYNRTVRLSTYETFVLAVIALRAADPANGRTCECLAKVQEVWRGAIEELGIFVAGRCAAPGAFPMAGEAGARRGWRGDADPGEPDRRIFERADCRDVQSGTSKGLPGSDEPSESDFEAQTRRPREGFRNREGAEADERN